MPAVSIRRQRLIQEGLLKEHAPTENGVCFLLADETLFRPTLRLLGTVLRLDTEGREWARKRIRGLTEEEEAREVYLGLVPDKT